MTVDAAGRVNTSRSRKHTVKLTPRQIPCLAATRSVRRGSASIDPITTRFVTTNGSNPLTNCFDQVFGVIDAVAVVRLSDASRRAVRASNRDSVGQRRPVGRER